ncbi:hypothetical protein AGMMS49525_12220 [Bacteroidia bacterium]|nr:hypothetical protein AGMMS49525_12220 [Bacteroidia bacterium]
MTRYIFSVVIALLICVYQSGYAKYNVIECDDAPVSMEIIQVDFTGASTLVFFKYTNLSDKGAWINFDENTYLRDVKTGNEYKLLSAINMPISEEGEPKAHIFDKVGQYHYFCLEFEELPKSVEEFNLIENENNPTAFNFYRIRIDKQKTNDFVNVEKFIKPTPVKEYGMNMKDGNLITYFKYKGLSISMVIVRDKNYGNYYQAWINIQNFTGKSLLLSPNKITAQTQLLINKKKKKSVRRPNFDELYFGNNNAKTSEEKDLTEIWQSLGENIYQKDVEGTGVKDLEVLSHAEYIKKVKNSQAWSAFAVALGNALAASNAGYSYSTTNVSATGQTNAYASVSGHVRTTYGFASGYGSSYSTAYGRFNSIIRWCCGLLCTTKCSK